MNASAYYALENKVKQNEFKNKICTLYKLWFNMQSSTTPRGGDEDEDKDPVNWKRLCSYCLKV